MGGSQAFTFEEHDPDAPIIRLLDASIDSEDESDLRLLVNGKHIKYLVVDSGVYKNHEMAFEPDLLRLMPPLPPGDWKTARISRDRPTGEPYFASTSNDQLQRIAPTWHPTIIDHLDLKMEKIRGNVHKATCAHFDTTVIVKFAIFDWLIPYFAAETEAYRLLQGQDIGPSFLGHLAEEGRIVGFILEYLPDHHHASPADLPTCQAALAKLHGLGIKHGDINKHNFLIRDGKATLIDFESAQRGASTSQLEEEVQSLPAKLEDTSGIGWYSQS